MQAAKEEAIAAKRSKGGGGSSLSGSKRPPAPDPEAEAAQKVQDSSKQPLVKIEVELVKPDGVAIKHSLADFKHELHSPFERALDNVLAQRGVRGAPLQQVFYITFREEVPDSSGSGKSFCIKWNAACVLCYCPFKKGKETIDEVNKCFPEGSKLEGKGDGCTYWHGKLVPGTRVGKVPWFDEQTIIEAVLKNTTEQAGRSSNTQVQQLKELLVHSAHRVVSRWFFNSRTLISDDKYVLKSFEPRHLELKAERAAKTDPDLVRAQYANTDLRKAQTQKNAIDKPGVNSQLVISEHKVRLHTLRNSRAPFSKSSSRSQWTLPLPLTLTLTRGRLSSSLSPWTLPLALTLTLTRCRLSSSLSPWTLPLPLTLP